MSFLTVRQAIGGWLGGPAVGTLEPGVYASAGATVAGLYTVRTSMPRLIPDTDYTRGATPPITTGAVGIVHLDRATRTRESFGGQGTGSVGQKRMDYRAAVVLFMQSLQPDAETAQTDMDAIVNAVITRLEVDPTLGGAVWQAAAAGPGMADLEVQWSEPMQSKGAALSQVVEVAFPVTEWFTV